MVQTGQIIYFSNQKMMCFDVESIEDITEPTEQIETTSVYGETRTYALAMMNPTTLYVTGKEAILYAINERMFSLGLIDEKTRDKIKAEISIRK